MEGQVLVELTEQEIAEPNTILRVLVGSTVHGLGVNDGVDDRDEMGVCIEPPSHVIGLERFDQWTHRTAPLRTGQPNARSGPGDLDLVIYSLRKFARLALQASPTILNLFFVKPEDCVLRTPLGDELQALASAFISRQAGARYLGYLQAQRRRLTGEQGQKDVNRPELVERYGYDTKYAMHMLRLGYQGTELLTTGRLSLPMQEPVRSYLRGVRTGAQTLPQVLAEAERLERELNHLREVSPLPPEPERARVDRWLIDSYQRWWSENDGWPRPDTTGSQA